MAGQNRHGEQITDSEIRIVAFRVSVHRHIDYPLETWLCSIYPGLQTARPLPSATLDDAKNEALAMLTVILDEALSEMPK